MKVKDYNKEIRVRVDKTLKYQYFLDVEHPLASKGGKVWYHRHVASTILGRWLYSSEHVHHKDGNKSNNLKENLAILTHEEHARLHQPTLPEKRQICRQCKSSFAYRASKKREYCSEKCSHLGSRKFNVTKNKLKELIWSKPTTHIAKMFSVSDKAIEKRCKKLGVKKPPRGYWTKNPQM